MEHYTDKERAFIVQKAGLDPNPHVQTAADMVVLQVNAGMRERMDPIHVIGEAVNMVYEGDWPPEAADLSSMLS